MRLWSPAVKGSEPVPESFAKASSSRAPPRALPIFSQVSLIQEEGLADSEAATVVIAVEEHDL
jgi:hypothetical protein